MVGNNWEEKRNLIRFPTDLKALYYLKEERESVEKCTIVNVSYKGFGIAFQRGEKINRVWYSVSTRGENKQRCTD
jgi:hypothetical protein